MLAQRDVEAMAWPRAKIAPPQPRALVSRRRLLGPLNAAVTAGRVTIVVAPGGSGKTSLLADWARQASLPVAWYALDAADRDMRRLVYGLCAAVERVLPGASQGACSALDKGALEAAAVGILLGSLEDRPLTLVLDDLQHLDDLPEAVALWDHLLRFRPPTLSLVILSRSIPLMGFAALAAFDELLGLGRAELCFDATETADLLTAHGLDACSAAGLAARSGGWATGVLLLARAAPNGVRFLRARAEALMEPLGAEMLAALPHELREFLLESAVLGPVSSDDADAILGRHDSAALYAEVAARGLFLEQDNNLYRYHDLFAEYLVGALREEDSVRLQKIRRATAEWWAEHDDLPRGLGLLASGEDWEALSALLDLKRASLWARGLWGTALSHVEHLPPAYRTPRLLALCGRARAQRGEHAEALVLADAAMAAASDDSEWLDSAVLRTQALVLAGRNDEGASSAEAALVIANRVENIEAVTRLHEWRGLARLRVGRFGEGRSDLLLALTAHKQVGDEEGEARTLSNLASHLIVAGHARDTGAYLERAGVLRRRAGNVAVLSNIHNARALLHMLTGDLITARSEAERAQKIAHDVGNPLLECIATATLAEVCADAADDDEAERQAAAASGLAARLDLPDVLNDALRARVTAALLRREGVVATCFIDEARALVVMPTDSVLLDLYEGIISLKSRAYDRATEILSTVAERLEALSRPHQAARAHLLHAEALLALGNVRRADGALNRMAELVLPLGCEGYLKATVRFARRVMAERRTLRRLRRETRLLLDSLAEAAGPTLSLLPPVAEEEDIESALRVAPFGHGRLVLGDQDVDIYALPPKARELLFYAAHMGRPLTRDDILEGVWEGELRGAQALWDASRHLRRVLGERNWGPRNGAYALRLTVRDDGRGFDEAVTVALGSGPTIERLAGAERALDLVGAGGYLEWCDTLWAVTERARVADRSIAVALAAAELYMRLDCSQDALTTCRRAIAFDSLDEAPRLALLRILVAIDQVDTAAREYNAYRLLLRDELAAEPSAELRAFAAGLKNG